MSNLTKVMLTIGVATAMHSTHVMADEKVIFLPDGSVKITVSGEGDSDFGLSIFTGGGNFLTVYASGSNFFYCGLDGELPVDAVAAIAGTTGQSVFFVTPECAIVKQEPVVNGCSNEPALPPLPEKVATADWEYMWGTDYVGFVQNPNSLMEKTIANNVLTVRYADMASEIFSCNIVEGSLAQMVLEQPSEQAFYQIGKDAEGNCSGAVEISSYLLQ